MEVRPGDYLLLPFPEHLTDAETAKFKDELIAMMPEVKIGFIEGVTWTTPVVCRGVCGNRDAVGGFADPSTRCTRTRGHDGEHKDELTGVGWYRA